MARQAEHAAGKDPGLGRDQARLEPRQGNVRLDRRSGLVAAGQEAVEQRAIGIVEQTLVARRGDAVDEPVRVVARLADQRQDLAAGNVEHDHRAGLGIQCLKGLQLEIEIDVQTQIVAGHGIDTLEYPDHPPLGVRLDAFDAGLSVEVFLVIALDSGLARMRRRPVLVGVQAREIIGIEARHITDHVGQRFPVRIVAGQVRLDVQAFESVPLQRQDGDLFFAQVGFQGDRLERATAQSVQGKALAFVFAESYQVVDDVEHGSAVFDPIGHHDEAIGCPVLGQHAAVAVENQAAVRGHGLEPDSIVLGPRGQGIVIDQLKIGEASDDAGQGQQHEHRDHDESPVDAQLRQGIDRRRCPAAHATLPIMPGFRVGAIAARRGSGTATARSPCRPAAAARTPRAARRLRADRRPTDEPRDR
jgi:hypothetical protein